MKTLRDLNLKNKRALLRADFNIPINDGVIDENEDWRIRAVIPTINYIKNQNAEAIIIIAHLGRPGGKYDENYSLAPVAEYLEKISDYPIKFIKDFEKQKDEVKKARGVMMLENIRFWPGEELNDQKFAKNLADLGNVYINDAFADSHRAHASIAAIPKYLDSAAGLLLEKEVMILNEAMKNPKRPLAVIIGGVKISTKIKLIKKFLNIADHLILGGALVNTVLQAQGTAIGRSITESAMVGEVKGLELTNTKLHIPVDVVVSREPSGKSPSRVTGVGNVTEEDMILDIGPDTNVVYEQIIKTAKMIIWNGPMGLAEVEAFSGGTKATAKAVSESGAYSIIGGGDTVAMVRKLGLADKIGHLSTGGGAMLEFLAGDKLPGIEALK